MRKDGLDAFVFDVIDEAADMDELNYKERLHIEALNTLSPRGYNLDSGGTSGGKKASETRRLISESHRRNGHRPPGFSWKGKTFSDEHRKALAIAGTGRVQSEDTRLLLSQKKRLASMEKLAAGLDDTGIVEITKKSGVAYFVQLRFCGVKYYLGTYESKEEALMVKGEWREAMLAGEDYVRPVLDYSGRRQVDTTG